LDFDYEGLGIRVESSRESHLAWLEEVLCPQFERVDVTHPRCRVILTTSATKRRALAERTANGPLIDLFVMDGFVVSGRRSPSTKPLIVKEEKTETIVSIDGSDIEIVAEPECPSIRMMLMRVVRELATNHLLARGALLLHAAAFVLDENGVLILGPSGAGKTTLLLAALGKGATYVANDRVFVRGDTAVRGVPTIVSLRAGTAAYFPRFAARLASSGFKHRKTIAECAPPRFPAPDKARLLTPHQLTRLLEVNSAATTRLAALMFPSITPAARGMRIEALSAEAAADRLSKMPFAPHALKKAAEVFSLERRSHEPNFAEQCRCLTSVVPAFEVVMGEGAHQEVSLFRRFVQR
jgi:hypothetical protein